MSKALKIKDTLSSQQEFNFESNDSLYSSNFYGSNAYAELSKNTSLQAVQETANQLANSEQKAEPTVIIPAQPIELFQRTESSIKELSIKCPFCKTKYIVARDIYNSFAAEKLPFDCFDCEREFFDKFPRPIVENAKEEVAPNNTIKHAISKVSENKIESSSGLLNARHSSTLESKRALPSLKLVANKSKENTTTTQNFKYPLVSHDEPVFSEKPFSELAKKTPTDSVVSESNNSLTTGTLENTKIEYSDKETKGAFDSNYNRLSQVSFNGDGTTKNADKNIKPSDSLIANSQIANEIEGNTIENYMSKSNSVKKQNKSQLTFTFNDSDKSFEDKFFGWLHNNIRSPWKATLLIIVPIIGFLGLMLAITVFFRLTPSLFPENLVPSILSAVSVAKSVPAPSGMIVQNTEFNTVVLENGETLYVISGKVTNTTDEEHKDVKVEGLAFNNKGELIHTTLGYLSNPLNVARIRSLSSAEVFDLQVSKKDRFDKIKPNESQKFTIVLSDKYITEQNYSGILKVKTSSSSGEDSNGNKLNGTELKFANYFSARVYSVGK